ncbi:MAG: hypothetical protein ABI193_01020 [Minicystis sp.]
MNTRTFSRSLVALSLLLGSSALGCGRLAANSEAVDAATEALATDGSEAVSSNDASTGALTDTSIEAVSADPVDAAKALAIAPPDAADGACRSRAKDPNDPATVIITLTDCTGRFGKHHVSGTEIVHFSKGEGPTLHADFHSENLTFDGTPASHVASADITFAEGTRTIVWQGSLQREGKNGGAVDHSSDLTIVVDTVTHCRTRNGSAVTSFGDHEIDTSFQDVKVCRDPGGAFGCPTGEVTHTNAANGKQITVTFDGSDQAVITGPKGQTFEKDLVCGG